MKFKILSLNHKKVFFTTLTWEEWDNDGLINLPPTKMYQALKAKFQEINFNLVLLINRQLSHSLLPDTD